MRTTVFALIAVVLVGILFNIVYANPDRELPAISDINQLWSQYKKTFNKHYNAVEEAERFNLFKSIVDKLLEVLKEKHIKTSS